eukprot:m.270763 g.270763  ORF g.270763 m.270763 type:complete len:794 (-) comp19317_c0_seq16:1018-3399(-)
MDEGVMFTAATAVTFGTTTLLMALAVRWALRKHARATSHDDDDDVDGGDAGPRSPGEQFLFDCEQPAAVDAVKEHLASDAGLVEAHPGCVHAAVASGSLAILQLVLRAATPVFRENLANARSQGTGVTPLIVAADRGLWEHAELLLDSGADANRADASGHTPLFLAACNGHDDLVRLLLERGSNPFAVNKTRKSALHFAAHNEHNDVVKQLLDAAFKARPASGRSDLLQQADVSGYTALHSACVRGAPATAKVLIDAGADVNTTARDGSTPLAVACRSQNASDMVQLLLDHGSHIQGVNTFGATLLHAVCSVADSKALSKLLGRPEAAELVTAQDNDGLMPLHVLCQTARKTDCEETSRSVLQCARALLDAGCAADAMDYGDCTPLHFLASGATECSYDLIDLLVRRGASALVPNGQRWTPLHVTHNALKDSGVEGPSRFMLERVFEALHAAATREDATATLALDLDMPRDCSNTAYLRRRGAHNRIPLETRRQVLQGSHDVTGIASFIKRKLAADGTCKIVVLAGAGVSVPCGIPDFRTPGTGLYSNPETKMSFGLDSLMDHPDKFYATLKKVFLPVMKGQVRPSLAHHLGALLEDKGLLCRVHTQNVEGLDTRAGVPKHKVVEAHGSLEAAHCMSCAKPVDGVTFWTSVDTDTVPRCDCGGLIAPNIVFFGTEMPQRFLEYRDKDLKEADVLIVMGTSLLVYPFAGMVSEVGLAVPRLLINREPAGPFRTLAEAEQQEKVASSEKDTTDWADTVNFRDAIFMGDCEDGVLALCEALGWKDELLAHAASINP